MPLELVLSEPHKIELREYKDLNIGSNEVKIKSLFSSPKHGTEIHAYQGDKQLTEKYFDPKYKLHRSYTDKYTNKIYPKILGNITVGTIIVTGKLVKDFKDGDLVYSHLPIREIHIFNTKDQLLFKQQGSFIREKKLNHVPLGLNNMDVVCLDPAHFALAALKDAKVNVGDNIAIFGMGAIGLIAVQLAKISGCQNIIAIDPKSNRRSKAKKLGATHTINPEEGDVGMQVKDLTNKKGVDVSLEISGNYDALQEAIRSTHYSGLVVTASYYSGNTSNIKFGEEWHHTRVTIKSSMPVWGNPSRDYPQWNNSRIEDTILKLMMDKKINTEDIVEPIINIKDAPNILTDIFNGKINSIKLGVMF